MTTGKKHISIFIYKGKANKIICHCMLSDFHIVYADGENRDFVKCDKCNGNGVIKIK